MITNDSDTPDLLIIKRKDDDELIEIISLGNGSLENLELQELKRIVNLKGLYIQTDTALEMTDFDDLKQHLEEMIL